MARLRLPFRLALAASLIITAGATAAVLAPSANAAPSPGAEFNYAEALQESMLFY